MDFAVIWSPRARKALLSICKYIAEANPSAATELELRILAKTKLLQSTPRIGNVYMNEPDREIRQLIEGHYRIFYKVNELRHLVEILLVWHAARQEPKL